MGKFLDKLLPNGLGTRALIAFAIVGGAVYVAIIAKEYGKLFELATLVVGFYFVTRRNGNGHTPPPGGANG